MKQTIVSTDNIRTNNMSTKARIQAIRNQRFTPPFEILDTNHIVTNDACVVELTLQVQNDVFVFRGSSRRAPGDESNFQVGYFIALQRAWNSAGNKLRKRANGLMKHSDDVQANRAKLRANPSTGPKAVKEVASKKASKAVKKTAPKKVSKTSKKAAPKKVSASQRGLVANGSK